MNKSLEQRLIEKQPLTTPEIGMQQKPSNSKEIKIIITNYHFHFIITMQPKSQYSQKNLQLLIE
jgi:hypothetical protein